MVKTNAGIYIRQSSDDETSGSDDQLHEPDVVGYAISLSQIRRPPKFVDNGADEERCA